MPYDVLQIIIIVSVAVVITLGIIYQILHGFNFAFKNRCRNCGTEVHDEDMKCPICNYADPDNLLSQARRLWFRNERERALEVLTTAVKLDSTRADIWYEKARYECQQRIFEEAITSLETACGFDGSYVTFAQYADSEFKPLRTDPRFRRLVKSREDELERLGIRITWGEQDF